MLPIKNRITLPSEFYKIKKFGKRISNSYFNVTFINESSLISPLFSVIVSKVIAKKASQRNKLKRIAKGLIIRNCSKLPQDIKCLVFPKLNSLSLKNKDLEVEFLKLFEQIKNLRKF